MSRTSLSVFAFGFVLSAQARSATLPTPAEVNSLSIKEICYSMTIEVTKLQGRQAYAPLSFPICVEMPVLQAAGDCRDDYSGRYACPVAASDAGQKYLRVSTPGYEFASYFGGVLADANAFSWPVNVGSAAYLELYQQYYLEDVWSLRLTQIVNLHKAELPVEFASLMFPANSGSNTAIGGTVLIEHAGDARQFTPQGHAPALLQSVQALGYDADGAEYGVHIATSFDHVTY